MKKVSLLLVLVFATIGAFAQERGHSTKAGRNSTFVKEGFWDNWFIGAGAGANIYFGDSNDDADFLNRMTVVPNIQFGKWHNPYFGGRIKAYGGSLHNFFNDAKDMLHGKHVGVEADLMWNVSNYLGKYNENRFYSFIPFAGIGGVYGWDYEMNGQEIRGKERCITVNGGLINRFRLSNRLFFDIELSAVLVKESFNKGGGKTYDGLGTASANLVYKVGSTTDFQEAVLMDQGLLDDLNGQINKLRQENARLSQRPENCPKCPETQVVEKVVEKGTAGFGKNVVFFRIGSSNVDKHQEINIYNTAKYLQENPNAKVKVVGYADKQTGSASLNQRLSEKRAKNVANALITKYNINSNRVTVEWKGDTEQPYAENAWNRVAIFFAE